MKNETPKPSAAMTVSLFVALTAFYFTSEILFIWILSLAILWTHFLPARYPRDASAAWIVRLLCYGGIFAFYGGRPGVGADWIFDAKTFNTIGLIAASEAVLQAWREPPPNLRFQPLLVLQSGIVFLAGCNTYDDRYIRLLAPLYLASTLLALRDIRFRESNSKTRARLPLQTRRVLALLLVLVCGGGLHYSITSNKDQIQIWGLRMMRRRLFETAGISNQPTLRSTFNLQGSTRRVLRIEGALDDGHLRAASFDTYSGGRWSPTLDTRAKTPFPETAVEGEKENVARITKLVNLNNLILAPLNAVALTPQEGSSFDWDKTLGPLRCEDPAPYTYEVVWSDEGSELGVPLHQGVLCAPPSPTERKKLLEVAPEVDPRVRELAKRVTKTARDDADKVEAIATYLLTHNKYSYTTQRGREDPVSSFILERKAAHCEYFASAAAIMLRCAGVPTRYATGFLAHETEGNQTTVRQRDAHAWTEAYIQNIGWINVDATPADGTPEAQPQVSWFQKMWEKAQDRFTRLRESFSGFSRPQLFGFILIVVMIWFGERWRQARNKKRLEEAAFQYSTPEEMSSLAARFETLLQKRKIILPEGKPWSEYFADETDAPPEYEKFVAAYNRARFGGAFNRSTLDNLLIELARLEKSDAKGNGHAHGNAEHNNSTNRHADEQSDQRAR
jgi:transglutaminase-like putative cysteine protease